MKVLLTGAGGQVGRALLRTAPSEFTIEGLTRAQLDLADRDAIAAQIDRFRPALVINAAAYTAVDRAESEREQAHEINGTAVRVLAENCARSNAVLLHLSTDYVFDGSSSDPYEPSAETRPVNAYGESKLAGELAIKDTSQRVGQFKWAIVRTSWVYAPWGANFVRTMLRLMRERGEVSVVNDQIGAPTSALSLSRFLWRLAARDLSGSFHYADGGMISWYEFAVAIAEEGLAAGLLERPAIVKPIPTANYPTPAKRPAYSLLSTHESLEAVGIYAPHWRTALREVLLELKHHV